MVKGCSIFGYDFALIGDPGNRDTNAQGVPTYPDTRIGGVDCEFGLDGQSDFDDVRVILGLMNGSA